ncbi:iron-containing alcohol dehydrogenase [Kutzneria sp. NPDC052558]|uniref:iron-containing alcohol dehydrogenase n=1 Tax=Kutzneria sp. NPDC052558 TaxID=3364121 RepID=UPI0037C9D81B
MIRTGMAQWPQDLARAYESKDVWRGVPLGEWYRRWAAEFGSRTAIVDGARRVSYAELADAADQTAQGLLDLGLRGGENILAQLPNSADFVVFLLACTRIGVAPVLMLRAHRDNELIAAARHVKATAVVVSGEDGAYDFVSLGRRVRDAVDTVRHVIASGEGRAADVVGLDALGRPAGDLGSVAPDPRDVALFLLSGGTTGQAKLIGRTHNDYEYNFRRSGEVCGFGPDTVYLAALPAGHNFPLGCPGILGTLAVGGTVVLVPSPNPESAFAAIAREKVTAVATVPAVLHRWAEHARSNPADLSSLKLVQVGGSVLTPQAYRSSRDALGCPVQQVFGMAEGLLNFTGLDDDEPTTATTQGRPMSEHDEILVVDESGTPVPAGAEGELLTRGPYTPRGYFDAPEHNRRSFTPDGWYRTGDLVRLAHGGNLVVTGRSKDIINRGGEKIATDEIEQFAVALPDVAEAAVVPYPDPELGERVCLFVVPASGRRAPALPELRAAFLAIGVAAFKIPERIESVAELPHTAIGKVDKKALRRLAEKHTTSVGSEPLPHNLLVSPAEPDTEGLPRYSWVVQAERPVEYEVRVSRNLFDPANPSLLLAGETSGGIGRRRVIVVDSAVDRIYGDQLRAYLAHHTVDARLCVLDATEENKTMDAVFRVIGELDEFGIDRRREPVIGIGGGVLLDIVGLACSLYRRHTPYVRVPTTLIGLVDAGVGAKTGVNFGGHKNRLGSYEPPVAALLDRAFLSTLDERHIRNGLAEILKIALIKDAALFDLLEQHGAALVTERLQGETPQTEAATRGVLRAAVHGMLEELQPNLWEHSLERLVDYGHTFSPTIEMRALPALLHGEAVNVDMALTTVIGWRRGLVTDRDRDRILDVMRALRLPTWHPECAPEILHRALVETTRHRDGQQRLPLPVGIGSATFVNDVTLDELAQASRDLAETSTLVGEAL